MQTQCPYFGCPGSIMPGGSCRICGRRTKVCDCRYHNRLFARFCRDCGRPFGPFDSDWTESRGVPGRNGRSTFSPDHRLAELDYEHPLATVADLDVPGACRSLLVAEGYVFAFWESADQSGVRLARLDGRDMGTTVAVTFPGRMHAEPLLYDGSLYVACGRALFAYTLSALLDGRQQPRWRVDFPSMPVASFLAVEHSLYLPLADVRGERSALCRVDGIDGETPSLRCLVEGSFRTSCAVQQSAAQGPEVYFLASDAANLFLGSMAHGAGRDTPSWTEVQGAAGDGVSLQALSTLPGRIFAVLDREQSLCCIDIRQAMIMERIATQTQGFALSGRGKVFSTSPVGVRVHAAEERLGSGESVQSQPVILGDFAAAVGLSGGAVRLYDMGILSRSREWAAFGMHAQVTHLAPSGEYLVAGSRQGQIRVARFTFNTGARDALQTDKG